MLKLVGGTGGVGVAVGVDVGVEVGVGVKLAVAVAVAVGVKNSSCRRCRSWRWAKESALA